MYTVKNEYSHFGASIPTIRLRQFKGRYSNCILPTYSSRSSTLYAVRPQGKVINEAQFGKELQSPATKCFNSPLVFSTRGSKHMKD